jgi:hypothetical protein
MFLIQEAFAGAWSLVWHWGAGVAIIILCLAAAYFSPLYKKYFLGAAAVVALLLVAYGVGIADQASREQAQQKVIIKYVDRVVANTKTPKARKRPDKWDNRNY